MITRIEVDGFKSLTNFKLNFVPGLNILVGPNGSGKTNIVSFFEYLGYLMDTDASEATSRAGGAGAVFRRLGEAYEKQIRVRIVGSVKLEGDRYSIAAAKKARSRIASFCVYEYTFTLLFPDTRDSVLFETQRVRLRITKEFELDSDSDGDRTKWGVNIESQLNSEGGMQIQVSGTDLDMIDLAYSYYHIGESGSKDSRKQALEQLFAEGVYGNNSLLAVLSRYARNVRPIVSDLSAGQIYNIIPSRVKLPEDSAKPAGIARDGSGLAATLYALQRSKNASEFRFANRQRIPAAARYNPQTLDHLRNYLQLVNDTIERIEVTNDPFDNQLRVRFQITSGKYEAAVPLAFMSDGTLKWVALVTAALTATSVFSIEEPENYLHPRMQGYIVNILREILFGDNPNRFTLMTTHSETLLNHCKPEELIIVSVKDGQTVAKRCDNQVDINDEISRTGFGLGYYYLSDILSNDLDD